MGRDAQAAFNEYLKPGAGVVDALVQRERVRESAREWVY
jgi:hypothetical protein